MDVYRSRFVQYPTAGINCLAFSHSTSDHFAKGEKTTSLRLAVGRANGDIEIWNPHGGLWAQEITFKGGKDRSVESLVWIQEPTDADSNGSQIPGALRLFSIGYSSTVTEWNLATGLPLRQWAGNHSEVWCIAAQPRYVLSKKPPTEWTGQNLVAGCADGSLVTLSTEDNDLQYRRFLARPTSKRARVLSIAFQNRMTVIAGFADSTIRIYNMKEGRLIRNISLGAGPTGGPKEILVWSVKCLANGDIISGDSIGEVRVFDKKLYSQVQRLASHDSDILDLVVSQKQKIFFSAGMDRRTAKYVKTSGHARYSKARHATYHEHDIKAMASFESNGLDVIASGGVDTNLVIMPLRFHGEQYQYTISGLSQTPPMDSTAHRGIVICWWAREVSVWKVFTSRGFLPQKKHELRARIALKGEENVTSAIISPSGNILVAATVAEIKVFQLTKDKTRERTIYTVQKRPSLGTSGAKLLKYSPDGTWVSALSPQNEIQLFKISDDGISNETVELRRRRKNTLHTALGVYLTTINRFSFSPDSKMLVASDLSGYVDSWIYDSSGSSLPNGTPQPTESDSGESSESDEESTSQGWSPNSATKNTPKFTASAASITFRPETSLEDPKYNLFIMTAKHQLYELDMTTGFLTDWSRRNSQAALPDTFKKVMDRNMGAFWGDEGWLWLYGSSWVFGVNVSVDHRKEKLEDKTGDESEEEEPRGKKRKWEDGTGAGSHFKKEDLSGLIHLPGNPHGKAKAEVNGDEMEVESGREEKQDNDDEDDEDDSDDDFVDDLRGGNHEVQKGTKTKANWFITHKYRPILGIVPVHPATDKAPPEVMLVERPIWSLNLPARYESIHSK